MATIESQDLILFIVDDDSENFNVSVKIENMQDVSGDTEAYEDTCEDLFSSRESSQNDINIHSNSNLFDVSVVKEESNDDTVQEDKTSMLTNRDAPAETSKELCIPEENWPDQEIEYLEEEYDEDCIQEESLKKIKKTHLPDVRNSYISDLQHEFPELKEDEELLIEVLARIMKELKPPPVPEKFYIQALEEYVCVICGATAFTLPAIERHYLEKHGSRYLVCFACGVTFRSRTNLYKHEKRCKAKDIDLVLKARAVFLGRKGQNRPYLDMYQNSLSVRLKKNTTKSSQRFPCTLCSSSYGSKVALQSHVNKHLGIRPYRCDKCSNAYSCPLVLRRHLEKHKNIQYICDNCKRDFKSKTSLITHMDTHLPIRKYGCTECDRRYANKNALNLHINKIHKNLPHPYGCHICSKRYARTSVLSEHMKKEHGLNIMTRTMYHRKLPTMTEQDVLEAKVVLANDIFASEDPIILNC